MIKVTKAIIIGLIKVIFFKSLYKSIFDLPLKSVFSFIIGDKKAKIVVPKSKIGVMLIWYNALKSPKFSLVSKNSIIHLLQLN